MNWFYNAFFFYEFFGELKMLHYLTSIVVSSRKLYLICNFGKFVRNFKEITKILI